MGQYTKWIQHKGKRILFVDCSNLGVNEPEFLNALDQAIEELRLLPEKSVALSITDVSGSRTTPAIVSRSKEMVKVVQERGIRGVGAVIGVDGVKKTLAKLIDSSSYYAANMEDAKEWVVTHAN